MAWAVLSFQRSVVDEPGFLRAYVLVNRLAVLPISRVVGGGRGFIGRFLQRSDFRAVPSQCAKVPFIVGGVSFMVLCG